MNKHRKQLEPQTDNWTADLSKLEGKARKAEAGRNSGYNIIMAALRQPRDKTKRKSK